MYTYMKITDLLEAVVVRPADLPHVTTTIPSLLTETVLGQLTLGAWLVAVDSHAMDQTIDRQVLPTDIERVLRKIPEKHRELKSIESGQRFWVYDPELDTALGFRMTDSNKGRIILKTALGHRPWEGPIPIIDLDRPAPGGL